MYFVFIIKQANELFISCTNDLVNSLNFYNKMPNCYYPGNKKMLIYFERFNYENESQKRHKEIISMSIDNKYILIKSANPTLSEIENIETFNVKKESPMEKYSHVIAKVYDRFRLMKVGDYVEIDKEAKKDPQLFIEICKEFINQGNHDFEFSNDYKYFKRIEKYNF